MSNETHNADTTGESQTQNEANANYPRWAIFPLPSPRFEELKPFPVGENPFNHDGTSMGMYISHGKDSPSYCIMYRNDLYSLIVYDPRTGRRFKLTFIEREWVNNQSHHRNVHYGYTDEWFDDGTPIPDVPLNVPTALKGSDDEDVTIKKSELAALLNTMRVASPAQRNLWLKMVGQLNADLRTPAQKLLAAYLKSGVEGDEDYIDYRRFGANAFALGMTKEEARAAVIEQYPEMKAFEFHEFMDGFNNSDLSESRIEDQE